MNWFKALFNYDNLDWYQIIYLGIIMAILGAFDYFGTLLWFQHMPNLEANPFMIKTLENPTITMLMIKTVGMFLIGLFVFYIFMNYEGSEKSLKGLKHLIKFFIIMFVLIDLNHIVIYIRILNGWILPSEHLNKTVSMPVFILALFGLVALTYFTGKYKQKDKSLLMIIRDKVKAKWQS